MNLTITELNSLIQTRTTELEALQAGLPDKQNQLAALEEHLSQRSSEVEELRLTLADLRALELNSAIRLQYLKKSERIAKSKFKT